MSKRTLVAVVVLAGIAVAVALGVLDALGLVAVCKVGIQLRVRQAVGKVSHCAALPRARTHACGSGCRSTCGARTCSLLIGVKAGGSQSGLPTK